MTRIVLFIGISIALCSCGSFTKDDVKKDVISYEMKNFTLESTTNCKDDSISCAYYEINYPVFNGLDSVVRKKLTQAIESALTLGSSEAERKSPQQLGEDFIKDYTEFAQEMPESAGKWYYSATVDVELMNDTLLSLAINDESYTGGAHGASNTTYVNINPKTGKDFTLDNLFKPGYQEELNKVGEKIFRHVRELADTASFQYNYFEFPDNKFELNDNYGFTPQGVVFFYNSYEIAPYAAGPTEIVIPYEELQGWLKK